MDRLVLSGSVQERHFIYPSFCDDSSMMRCRPIKHGEAVSLKKTKRKDPRSVVASWSFPSIITQIGLGLSDLRNS